MTISTASPTVARLRRMRRTPALRALVHESDVDPGRLVYPVFVTEVDRRPAPVESMPGIQRWPVDHLEAVAQDADSAGVGALLLFGVPAAKDGRGSEASNPDGVVQRGVRALRNAGFEGVLAVDVCLCEYTDHGHCGLVDDDGAILNDPTLERLAETAVSLAEAGADVVAPSAMMDGQVRAVRDALDRAGSLDTAIMAYSAKYASAFYGPFRDAAQGAPRYGDRRSHQMDPANRREALREHLADVGEGADLLMVKPGLAYLDVIRDTRQALPSHPLVAYSVSGEYSMVKAAAERGWLDERAAVMEGLTAFRRAGADIVITYHALDAARWIHESRMLHR